jgi:hypothetical protein
MATKEARAEDGSRTKYFYADSGQLLRLEDYSSDGVLTMSVDYRYDQDGHNTERLVRGGDGQQIRRLEFYFDKSGKPVVHREYDGSNTLQFTRVL